MSTVSAFNTKPAAGPFTVVKSSLGSSTWFNVVDANGKFSADAASPAAAVAATFTLAA